MLQKNNTRPLISFLLIPTTLAAVVACHVVGMVGNYYLFDLRPSRRLFFRCPIFC